MTSIWNPFLSPYILVFLQDKTPRSSLLLSILAIACAHLGAFMAFNHEFHSKSPSILSHESADRPRDRDASQLTRLGKKPVLKVCAPRSSCLFTWGDVRRGTSIHATPGFEAVWYICSLQFRTTLKHPQRNFGFLSLLGFSCTVLVTWEGTLL